MKTLKTYRILVLSIILIAPMMSYGQSNAAKKKLEAAKIGLITERLGLSPDQAKQFWPVYQQFTNQRRANQTEFRTLKSKYNPKTATESDRKNLIAKGQELKQNQLNLEKEFSDKLLSVINSKQLLSLRQAEDEFRKTILRKLQQRKQQQNRQQQQFRNTERMKKKRNGN